MEKQLKYLERISRQSRHHRTYLNQICDQKLRQELDNLENERARSFRRSATHRKLEQQRKQLLDVTVKHIVRERQHHSSSTTQITTELLPKKENLPTRPSSPSTKLPHIETSCHLFSHQCQLYPCQPVYHYTSFINREHDQTLRERNPSVKNSDLNSTSSSNLQTLFRKIDEKKYHPNRRQLAITIQNQHYLANRHAFIEHTMARLDEQSRHLHEQLANRTKFGYVKDPQHDLQQSLQRHLRLSAKFCA